ncbi:hypothetical protein [Hyphomicrobium sp. LHD-15]|uniref:hypothetical protein n=1 Tax=Hyphomicrobium sp. LHD-15 TaxID=3072142 RepID=UPI002810415B|nr:hypothetical protein [Hyphomicrobium sp. LHD-15]MDQ8698871.1 hypothetical protein [Hyphomicrobium sp. LHD-15]
MTDIKVNKHQWDNVSEAEKEKIVSGLRATGALRATDRIIGDPGVPEFTAETLLEPQWNPLKDLCKAACDTVAAAAVAWCTANTGGAATAVCIAAAEAARQACRDRC